MQAHRADLVDPLRLELLDVARVDLVQRAEALPVVGAVVGQPVLRFVAGVEDPVVGDALGYRRRLANVGAQALVRDGSPCVYVLGCHRVLLSRVSGGRSTGAVGADDRAAPRAALRRPPRSRRSGPGPRRCRSWSRTSSTPARRARGWPCPSSGSPAR